MNKLAWHFNRLRVMSAGEVVYRFIKESQKIYEGLFLKILQKDIYLGSILKIESDSAEYFKERENIKFYLDLDKKQKIVEFLGKTKEEIKSEAEEILEHKFTFFSFEKKDFGQCINWHYDYSNDKETPLIFGKSIDFRDEKIVGNIKYVWEHNRHQHLITLAKAYYLTGEERYAEEVVAQVGGWIDQNPYLMGVNWIAPLEHGIRLISWVWAYFFIRRSRAFSDNFCEKFLTSIYYHCEFIRRNESRFSSANNHLIGEASGLFIAGVVFPEFKKAKEWRKHAFNILLREIERQNYADGVNKEQAISYHLFVLDFFLLAGLLGERNKITFPSSYWEGVEKMLEFISDVMDDEGNIPRIGDSDDGKAVVLSESNCNPYQSSLATGAVLFNRSDFKIKSKNFDEKSFWLLGEDGYKKYNQIESDAYYPQYSASGFRDEKVPDGDAFREGGYYILRLNNEIMLIFDCGPLGLFPLAAHGHADALSFVLFAFGKEFIVDSGTYAYYGKRKWRDYFRGTSAHSTICIDGKSQSVSGGNFIWVKKARAFVEKWESNKDYDLIRGYHNGYLRLKDPVVHRREIQFDKKKKVFILRDFIEAKKEHLIEQFFHFSEKCRVEEVKDGEWRIENAGVILYLKRDKKFSSRLTYGEEDPIRGWSSKRFDIKTRIFTLINSTKNRGECEFETLISFKE